jgi:hypothetical protein
MAYGFGDAGKITTKCRSRLPLAWRLTLPQDAINLIDDLTEEVSSLRSENQMLRMMLASQGQLKKRKRGRPRKQTNEPKVKRKIGRPKMHDYDSWVETVDQIKKEKGLKYDKDALSVMINDKLPDTPTWIKRQLLAEARPILSRARSRLRK